jgi:DNA-binding transcriptional ArsR family regulator
LTLLDAVERRARLGVRHQLATRAKDVESVAADLIGLHSSDPATVYLAAWARVEDFTTDDLERALYENKSLVRMLGMRRTMFVVTPEVAATMDAAVTKALVDGERKRMIRLLEEGGIAGDGRVWLDGVLDDTMAALEARGEATARELAEDVPELREKIQFGEGKKWGGSVGMSTRVLFLLATSARIVRARPLGTWLSSQYRWTPTTAWLGAELPALDVERARRDLVSHWLRTFGPGTEVDLKWWTGWTLGHTRSALDEIEAVEVEFDGGAGYALADDLDITAARDDWVALLPGLDPTVMGWKERDWYFGDHTAELFDRNGNAGPTAWWNGRVVGGWAQRPDGEVVVELLEPVPGSAQAMIDSKAVELTEWLDGVVVTPRFRTPLEKRLSS